ncbi:MAG: N(5)-(carboxyethyl)ornithine synthase [Tissierellia bacterium]|nr:N(5)-(carboxyethyl)ornithine synthase [Tissierellia bacterium]
MKTVGLLISHKNGEKRRALLPSDIKKIKNPGNLYFEKGYAASLNIEDREYQELGCNMVSREEALKKDILIDVKLGDADYIESLEKGKILFGWAHAVQSLDFTTAVLKGKHTVFAWEDLYEDGRYIFYKNREIAGEAAILHAIPMMGFMPYEARFAILGNGKTSKGVQRILYGLGAKEVDVFGRRLEKLFRKEMFKYDVIVNCVLWDTNRTDRLIYKEDLKKFKKGTFIVDVSCDPNLEIETSHPTTIENPIYEIDGVIHYAVDNTPALFSKTVSQVLSPRIAELINELVDDNIGEMLEKTRVIDKGRVILKDIKKFRDAKGLPSEY